MGKNTLKLDTKGLEPLMRMLSRLDEEVAKATIEDTLTKAAERVQMDTHIALNKTYLPAHGKYWTGQTAASVVEDTTPRWEGQTAWVPVGFDFSRPGAGGYLISGTPKMNADPMLNKMYRGKAYMREIQDEMFDAVNKKIQEVWDAG